MLIKYNAPRVLGIGGFIVVPGINNVPDSIWKDFEKDPSILRKIDKGEITVVTKSKSKDAAPVESKLDVKSLLTMDPKVSVKLAKETLDVELLRAWEGEETRPKVLKALQMQLKQLGDIEFRESESDADPKTENGEV